MSKHKRELAETARLLRELAKAKTPGEKALVRNEAMQKEMNDARSRRNRDA